MELFPSGYEPGCPMAMYKKQLQELVQKAGSTLPFYQNVNEGSAHVPKFRASVSVGKTKYTSKLTFTDKRTAEEDVAKLAYGSMKNIKLIPELGPLLVHQEPMFCKSILHEYAVKMNLNIPKYQTIPQGGPMPEFISSFEFCGKTYTSTVAESKKVAEQLAAKAAIQSLLGTLHKVIKSKEKLYASLNAKKDTGNEGTSKVNVQQPGTIPYPQQQTSIQTEIINYSTSRGAFPNAGSGIKRKLEFKNKVQNKNRCYGRAVGKQP